jgi:hypothetical protein
MADEIVAKYKVDVSGASAALDQLAAKTQKTGQTLDDSFNKGSDGAKRLRDELAKQPKTLADLEARLVKLKELLRDDTKIGTEGFKQVTKAINDTNAAIKQANSSLAETPKKTSAITSGMKQVGAAIVAAFAIDKIVSFIKESVNLAAKAEGVERAFAKIGDADLLAGLRSATRGTVTDLVLMQNAVKANNFKIPLDQLGSLLKYAQSQARATGQDVDYLVESLITGIGRKSVLVLDNLQISAVELREKLGDVSLEAATVGQVAEAVGQIASASLAKMGDSADTTADKLAQLSTIWNNFSTKSGAAIIDVATKLGQLLELMPEDVKRTSEFMESLGNKSSEALEKIGETQLKAVQSAREAFNLAQNTPFAQQNEGETDRLQKELFVQLELLKAVQDTYKLRKKEEERREMSAQSLNDLDAQTIQSIDVQITKLREKEAEEAKLRASQIQNIFFVDKALADLNDELNGEATSLERITAILPLINALEEQRKTILGQETDAMKKLRLEMEALDKIERKRAEEYNKAREAEAARLLKQEEDNAKERVKIAEDMAQMLLDIEGYLATTSEEVRDFELADNQRFYDSRIEQATKGIGELAKTEEESAAIFQAIKDEKNKADEESQAAHNQRIFELNKALADRNAALKDAEQEKNEATQKQAIDLIQAGLSTFGSVYNSMMDIAQNASDFELAMLKKKYEEGSISLEFFEAEQIRIQRESAQRAKDAATFNAIIGAAQAAINALSSPGVPFPVALGFSLFAIAAAAAQVAAIQSQPLPQFAKGVVDLQGEGTATSDSIHAKLSKGESVITAKETSKHRGLLEAMNKGLAEKYILSNYVKPALDSAMLSGFADMGKSAELNGLTANLKDHNIIAAMDRNRQATVQGLKLIKQELSKNKRVNIRSKW